MRLDHTGKRPLMNIWSELFYYKMGTEKTAQKLLVRVYVPRLDKTCSPRELSIHFAMFPWLCVLTNLQHVQSFFCEVHGISMCPSDLVCNMLQS